MAASYSNSRHGYYGNMVGRGSRLHGKIASAKPIDLKRLEMLLAVGPEEARLNVCICGHPESEHAITGECLVQRRLGRSECGCLRYTPAEWVDGGAA